MRKFWKSLSSARGSKPVQDKKNDRSHVTVIPVISPEAGDEDIPFIPPKASLEGLPVEIQSAVLLNIRDIVSLKNLIHSSPTYHSAYRSGRLAILKRVLFSSIHPDVLYDAFSAINSNRTLTDDCEDRFARVKSFLSEYKLSRDTWTPPEHLDLESACRLAGLQNQVQHATKSFCQVAFSCFPFIGNQEEHCEQLSSHECGRFHRAFYRFEIFCNLFRDWKSSPDDENVSNAPYEDGDSSFEIDSMEKSDHFLSLFSPWEVEELACPDLRDINPHWDLSEDGPWLEENIEYLMALSLRFYRRMETSSPDRQMRFLHHSLRMGPSFLSEALKEPTQAEVYHTLYVDDPVEVHFEGDSVRGGPNVMWLWTTGNKMNFGYFLWQNETLREWGYVFWDQKRLEQWGVPNEEYETWAERRRAELCKTLAKQSS